MYKIQLINACNDDGASGSGNTSCYPPLGLISIASFLTKKAKNFDITVEIIDGQQYNNVDEMLELIDADICGFSVLGFNYKSTLTLTNKAKQNGAKIIWGNDHATHLAKIILKKHSEIDFISLGDTGETTFYELIKAIITNAPDSSYLNINNIAYRDGDKLIFTNKNYNSINTLPIIDRSVFKGYDLYFKNYNERFSQYHNKKIINMTTNFAKGCGWGQNKSAKCLYCDIHDLNMDYVNPERVWEELSYLKSKYGVNYIYEVCDNFTSLDKVMLDSKKSYLDVLIDLKPESLNDIEWFVYSRASDININMLNKLKKIGVTRVNIGFDSGDNLMLKTLSKGASQNINEKAAKLLFDNNFQLYCSFVLGSIGETEESLSKTIDFVKMLKKYGDKNLVALTASPLCPLPGARSWDLLLNPEYGVNYCKKFNFTPNYKEDYAKKYSGQDCIDMNSTSFDWINTFCYATHKQIWNATKTIQNIAYQSGTFTGGFGLNESKI